MRRFQHIMVLTHVPPFREACWHEGRISDDNWLPHFTCKAVGDVLIEAMAANPDHRMTVLCGHTHSGASTGVAESPRTDREPDTVGQRFSRCWKWIERCYDAEGPCPPQLLATNGTAAPLTSRALHQNRGGRGLVSL